MSQLIIPLAQAHMALLHEASQAPAKSAALLSTARKVEATLLDSISGADPKALSECASAIMNSGSLKALKVLPPTETTLRSPYGAPSLNVAFILAQPTAYLREAMKRGFQLGGKRRIEYLRDLGKTSDRHNRLQAEALILNGSFSSEFMSDVVALLHELPDAEARNVAPFAAKLLKACAKANPEAFQRAFEFMVGIHDPGAAHQHLMRNIALYGLLGAKKPAADVFENDDMKRLAQLVTSGPGKKELLETYGSLEDYLGKGMRAPKGLLADLERRRLSWRRPSLAPKPFYR